jgi:hypothetical protein
MKILLSTAYFPPVDYFSCLVSGSDVLIEVHETFNRQSYRNRCEILGPNGVQTLVVPVIEAGRRKVPVSLVEIDYSTPWQNIHKQSIKSAYGKSPYYIHIEDIINSHINNKYKYLTELNFALLNSLLAFLRCQNMAKKTTEFIPEGSAGFTDYRNSIHPKLQFRKQVPVKNFPPYLQTFSDRFPFYPRLSIIDLISNTGPETLQYLHMLSEK